MNIRLKYQTLPNLKVWTPMLNLMALASRVGMLLLTIILNDGGQKRLPTLQLLFISYLYGSDLANRVCHYFKRISLQMPVSSSIFWENKQFLSERLSNL